METSPSGRLIGQRITDSDKGCKCMCQCPLPQLGSQDEIEMSRFMEDFEYVDNLGAGGFATTDKCRCRIDGCLYAIKKAKKRIHNDADQLMEQYLL